MGSPIDNGRADRRSVTPGDGPVPTRRSNLNHTVRRVTAEPVAAPGRSAPTGMTGAEVCRDRQAMRLSCGHFRHSPHSRRSFRRSVR